MLSAPRGTRDFSSEEMQKRQWLLNTMKTIFSSFGYYEIQTPTFEHLELFTAKSGASIIEELYNFEDKSGRQLALRPELTAPVIRFYNEQLQMEPKPLKLFYFGNCFRYDRPQAGRYREFWQIGCELIGTDTPEAIAELIALGYTVLTNAGLENCQLHIGHVGLLQNQLEQLESTLDSADNYPGKTEILRLIDKEDFKELDSLLKTSGFSSEAIKQFQSFLECDDPSNLDSFADNDLKQQQITRYKEVLTYLGDLGVSNPLCNMKIARGLDYYTGIVFEIEAPSLGAEKQLCGGGEYQLIGLLGGNELASSGFAIGFDRTLLALEQQQTEFPTSTLDVYVIPVKQPQLSTALQVAQHLRSNKLKVDIDLSRRGLGKAIKYANAKNARYLIIIGPQEMDQNKVTLRNMSSGEQTMESVETAIKRIL